MPSLYILLPVYNAEKTLVRAIESVLWQLSESIKLLIINDGSTDNSAQIIEKYSKNLHILSVAQTNQWLSSALDLAIKTLLKIEKYPKNIYVARLDSDDEYTKTGAKDIIEYIQKTPGYMSYLFGLLNSDNTNLTHFNYGDCYVSHSQALIKPPVMHADSVPCVNNLAVYNNQKYRYNRVPKRGWDGIPSMRIGKDFWVFIGKVYFYIVHLTPNSLSRRLFTKEYAKEAIEITTILIEEFAKPEQKYNKKRFGDLCLILSRYHILLGHYSIWWHYFIEGVKNSPKNLVYIWINIIMYIPYWYKFINLLIQYIYFNKWKMI